MIELPEAVTLARQMSEELTRKRIESAVRGNSPHQFAFYNRSPEEYATILQGKSMGTAVGLESLISATVEPGYTLLLGSGGEKIISELANHPHAGKKGISFLSDDFTFEYFEQLFGDPRGATRGASSSS